MEKKITLEDLRESVILKRAGKPYEQTLGFKLKEYVSIGERRDIINFILENCFIYVGSNGFRYADKLTVDILLRTSIIAELSNFDYDNEIAGEQGDMTEEEYGEVINSRNMELYDLIEELGLLRNSVAPYAIGKLIIEVEDYVEKSEKIYTSAGYQLAKINEFLNDSGNIEDFLNTVKDIDKDTINKVADLVELNNYNSDREKIREQRDYNKTKIEKVIEKEKPKENKKNNSNKSTKKKSNNKKKK